MEEKITGKFKIAVRKLKKKLQKKIQRENLRKNSTAENARKYSKQKK